HAGEPFVLVQEALAEAQFKPVGEHADTPEHFWESMRGEGVAFVVECITSLKDDAAPAGRRACLWEMRPVGLEPVLLCGRLRLRYAAALQCLARRSWPLVGDCSLASGTALRLRGADPDRKGQHENRGRDRLYCHSTAPDLPLAFLSSGPRALERHKASSAMLYSPPGHLP